MNNRGCFVIQGVKLDERGHIVVDEFQNTTRPGIYAVGDVCGRALLTPGNFNYLSVCLIGMHIQVILLSCCYFPFLCG